MRKADAIHPRLTLDQVTPASISRVTVGACRFLLRYTPGLLDHIRLAGLCTGLVGVMAVLTPSPPTGSIRRRLAPAPLPPGAHFFLASACHSSVVPRGPGDVDAQRPRDALLTLLAEVCRDASGVYQYTCTYAPMYVLAPALRRRPEHPVTVGVIRYFHRTYEFKRDFKDFLESL
jgi:hypothetical protein